MDHAITEVHAQDIKTIGEKLIILAQSRGWCDEYDSFIGDLNKQITCPLPEYVTREPVEQTSDPLSPGDAHLDHVIAKGSSETDYPDLAPMKRDGPGKRAVKQRHAALQEIDILRDALETSRNTNFAKMKKVLGDETIAHVMSLHEEIHAMIQRLGYNLP